MIKKSCAFPLLAAMAAVMSHFSVAAVSAAAQAGEKPVFEVASIKPAQLSNPMEAMHGNARIGMDIDGMRVDIANLTLIDMVRIAYQVKAYQIVAPEWMKEGERWDIQASSRKGRRRDRFRRCFRRCWQSDSDWPCTGKRKSTRYMRWSWERADQR